MPIIIPGLEITSPKFSTMVIGSHDFPCLFAIINNLAVISSTVMPFTNYTRCKELKFNNLANLPTVFFNLGAPVIEIGPLP
jgi:hypothetical protein